MLIIKTYLDRANSAHQHFVRLALYLPWINLVLPALFNGPASRGVPVYGPFRIHPCQRVHGECLHHGNVVDLMTLKPERQTSDML